MKFIIDTLGGDNAPQAVFDGCALALQEQSDLNLVMVGKKADIEKFVADNKIDPSRIEIIEADEAVLNTDHPATFLKEKPNCSLAKCYEALRTREDIDACVSAGPTGAILTGAIFRIGRIEGISRPALVATIPTRTGKLCRVMDVGANMDCKPEYLYQFAHMASTYLALIGVENPRIGLLNVGAEEGKGNDLAKAAYNMLKESDLNFVGNVEADHVVNGEADAIIADGFSGNVFIKSLEGGCYYVSDLFKEAVSGNFFA
ncbi:MAG: phosphate acyltransferase PlsX, partial [Bacilli bacterium]|nr:phosphate acyltransferase PlsX [Bacilli bacterium]